MLVEAVVQRCSVKKVFLEISQNSQENTCGRVSFLTKRIWNKCFPVNFMKFPRTLFFTEHLWVTASKIKALFIQDHIFTGSITDLVL